MMEVVEAMKADTHVVVEDISTCVSAFIASTTSVIKNDKRSCQENISQYWEVMETENFLSGDCGRPHTRQRTLVVYHSYLQSICRFLGPELHLHFSKREEASLIGIKARAPEDDKKQCNGYEQVAHATRPCVIDQTRFGLVNDDVHYNPNNIEDPENSWNDIN